jgi:hypothetical protein
MELEGGSKEERRLEEEEEVGRGQKKGRCAIREEETNEV